MTSAMVHTMRWSARAGVCLLIASTVTGCSVFESSHVLEPQAVPAMDAVASADSAFVAEPFSLVAADSVGLATFGYEIAMWAELSPEALAQQY